MNEKRRLLLQIDLNSKWILVLRRSNGGKAQQSRPAYAKSYGAAGNSPERSHIYLNPRRAEKSQTAMGALIEGCGS